MSKNFRTAFPLKKNEKKPIQTNLDNIINTTQIKMREFMLKKQEADKKTNLLLGQEKTIDVNILAIQKEIENKQQSIGLLNDQFNQLESEITLLQNEIQELIKLSNQKEAKFKEDINYINSQLDSIKYGTLQEQSQKKFEIKKNLEEVVKYKEDNIKLRERLYILTSQLRELENEYSNSKDNEFTSIAKAKKGIETINDMFDHFNKIKQREIGEIEENENEDNGNINQGENPSNNIEEGKNE